MSFNRKKQKVALSSMVASFLLTAMKLVVGLITGSIGILSEAAHSALDLGAATLTYFAVRIGDKPADKEHPYGHSKVESIAALAEAGLLLATSAWIVNEAAHRLLAKTAEVRVTWYSIAVLIVSIAVDFSRSRALSKVAKETKSQALEADALHFSSDILSSAVVLGGLVFVAKGIYRADAIAGIAVAVLVAVAAFRLGKETISVLLDAAPEGITDQIVAATRDVKGVVSIENIRVKPAGPAVFVEMTITVSRTLSSQSVQFICASIEDRVRKLIPVADITIHSKPLALDDETVNERIHAIAAEKKLHAHNISLDTAQGKTHISFDVEIDSTRTIKEAHDIVSDLEKEIRRELDGDLDVSIHIDPLQPMEKKVQDISPDEEIRIKQTIMHIASVMERVHEAHNIQVLQMENGQLSISLHCSFDDDVPLEEVHEITSQLECLIQQKIPDIYRVVIHAEPLCAID